MNNKRNTNTMWFTRWLSMTLLLFVALNNGFAQDSPYILTAEQWNVPRTETAILSMPTLQSVMQAYQKTNESGRLLIKYPGGDEGTLWAYELRGWLISLGIASGNIELAPGSRDAKQLEIYVINSTVQQ